MNIISFEIGQIVKAGEPVFAAATNALLLKVNKLKNILFFLIFIKTE